MTMIGKLIRFGRRQLHTIISKDIIKPSSPTPSHLKTYNLSMIDQLMPSLFMPLITFYPNTGIHGSSHDTTHDLKNSLSQTLTKYYPFAGRYARVAPSYVDCNDNGAEFLEASIDTTLSAFLQSSQHEDLDQFFPHGLVNYKSNCEYDDQRDNVAPLEVQVNHFECGGVAVAVSLSHKIADGSSLTHFMNDWANMTRNVFSTDPHFIPFQYTKYNSTEFELGTLNDCVTQRLMFPNSKLNELKLKVKAMMTTEEYSGQPIPKLTRVEVLSWLLYKCAVSAATKTNSGSFKSTSIRHIINLRSSMIEKLPEKSIGNFVSPMDFTKNGSEMSPGFFISELKKQKMQFQAIRNMEAVLFGISSNSILKEEQRQMDNMYVFSSFCGYPAYEIDFGWGKAIRATLAGDVGKNCFVLLDAPEKDGIEVLVCLGKHDMNIVQNDPELLAFGQF